MEATYELMVAARGVRQGNTESFWRMYEMTLDDVYFQLYFTMASENDINPELEKVYITLAYEFYLLDDPANVVNWINEKVMKQLDMWFSRNREDILVAEQRGMYLPPNYQDEYIPALEADERVYTQALMQFLCDLPDLYRFIAVAVYYDNYTVDEISEMLLVDRGLIARRVEYIEKTLAVRMQDYCKKNSIAKKPLNVQKIRSALFELQKAYRYPYAEALYNNIRIKAIH